MFGCKIAVKTGEIKTKIKEIEKKMAEKKNCWCMCGQVALLFLKKKQKLN